MSNSRPRFVPVPSPTVFATPSGLPSPRATPAVFDLNHPDVPPDEENPVLHALFLPPVKPEQVITGPPHVLYDVRYGPSKSYISFVPPTKLTPEFADSFATNPPIPVMRLLCRYIPWTIIVKNRSGVTIMDVLKAIHEQLQPPPTEGEWWSQPGERLDVITSTWKRNAKQVEGRELMDGVKRVDWLGEMTMIAGIRKPRMDDEKEKKFVLRRVPDPQIRAFTWLLEMGPAAKE
ncbi:hypothetical protein FRC02_006668 [Tulasnella sp. 418]|nr:hypothetical protein FRC02_006668 [Tulasnella sp. 418]